MIAEAEEAVVNFCVTMKKNIWSLILLGSLSAFGQSNFSVEFVGLTVHPAGDRTAHLQPNKLDPNARFVVNYGAVITYEKYLLNDVFAVRGLQSVLADCSAGWASISHIGIKAIAFKSQKHRIGVSLGPAFMIRESWRRFEDYESSGFLNDGQSDLFGPIQYKIFPLAAEIEYEIKLNDKIDWQFSFTPGLPMALTFATGVKFWINRNFDDKLRLPKIKRAEPN